MRKNNKENNQEYFLVWDIQYTLLEKYIYRVIKNSPEQACSDEEIAAKLCLSSADVKFIINDDCLNKFIQGDESRRTIASDFTKLECKIVKKNDKSNIELTKKGLLSSNTKLSLEDENIYQKIDHRNIPNHLEKHKAKAYYLIKNKEMS